jgi:tetratricopeptide (TPR) repeat protein
MKTRSTISRLSTFLFALAAVAGFQTTWAQSDPASYQMSVVLDRANGDLVARGNYDKAIVTINRESHWFPFATATNLCVAHTMVGQFKHAQHYCDEAVELAEKAALKGRSKNRDYIGEWATAFSNRGVLRARMGDYDGAADDFRLAIEKQSQAEFPAHNLAVLNHNTSEAIVAD